MSNTVILSDQASGFVLEFLDTAVTIITIFNIDEDLNLENEEDLETIELVSTTDQMQTSIVYIENSVEIIESIEQSIEIFTVAEQGLNGLSSYELAVKHGFPGTEEDYLDSLNGKVEGVGDVEVNFIDIFNSRLNP